MLQAGTQSNSMPCSVVMNELTAGVVAGFLVVDGTPNGNPRCLFVGGAGVLLPVAIMTVVVLVLPDLGRCNLGRELEAMGCSTCGLVVEAICPCDGSSVDVA